MSDDVKMVNEAPKTANDDGLSERPTASGLKRIKTGRAFKSEKGPDAKRSKSFSFTVDQMEELLSISIKFPTGGFFDEQHPKMLPMEKTAEETPATASK